MSALPLTNGTHSQLLLYHPCWVQRLLGSPGFGWFLSLPSISSCNFASLLTNLFSYFQTTLHHNMTKPLSAVFICLTFASPSPLWSSFPLELSSSQLPPVLSKLQHHLPLVFGAISFTLFLSQSTLLPSFWYKQGHVCSSFSTGSPTPHDVLADPVLLTPEFFTFLSFLLHFIPLLKSLFSHCTSRDTGQDLGCQHTLLIVPLSSNCHLTPPLLSTATSCSLFLL